RRRAYSAPSRPTIRAHGGSLSYDPKRDLDPARARGETGGSRSRASGYDEAPDFYGAGQAPDTPAKLALPVPAAKLVAALAAVALLFGLSFAGSRALHAPAPAPAAVPASPPTVADGVPDADTEAAW